MATCRYCARASEETSEFLGLCPQCVRKGFPTLKDYLVEILNGCVERAHRTHIEEFYEVQEFSLDVASLNRELMARECVYNTVRPHQSLGYLTPLKFLLKSFPVTNPQLSPMY